MISCPRDAAANAVEYLHRRRNADVGRDQHFLELIEERFVDLFAALKDSIEPVVDRVPGFLDRPGKADANLALDSLFLGL